MSRQIVLASGSARRRALLEQLGLDIEVRVSDVEETDSGTPEETVLTNARLKCDAVAIDAAPNELVIAADTIVVHDGQILQKPVSLDEARSMLQQLSGNTHHVLTAIAVHDRATAVDAHEVVSTGVTFRNLAPHEIERFIEIVQPLDRAGAYTVDGPGSLLVSGYDGCYYNVLGLPLVRLHELLLTMNIDLFSELDGSKSRFL